MKKYEGALFIFLIALFQVAAAQPASAQGPYAVPKTEVQSSLKGMSLARAGGAVSLAAAPLAPPNGGSGTYLGCYADKQARDLPAASMKARNMTPALCEAHCSAEGFTYAGTQYGSQCFCGNSFGRYGRLPQSKCNVPCAGNHGERCGGSWANSVYRASTEPRYHVRRGPEPRRGGGVVYRPAVPAPAPRPARPVASLNVGSGDYQGCYADKQARDLPAGFISGRNMTVELCQEHCRAEGFTYAGTQDGGQCFCGNSFGRYGRLPQAKCYSACSGNRGEACGGAWANSVYRVAAAPRPHPPVVVSRPVVPAPRPAPPVAQLSVGSGDYQGCYADKQARDLPAGFISGRNMTAELCQEHCRAEGFTYAGTQDGGQCFCGNSFGRYGRLPQAKCYSACSGNRGEACGGAWANSVYRVAAAPRPPAPAAPAPAQVRSYGRGAGTIPDAFHGGSCPRGREKQAGLCYVPCRSGYVGRGPVCWLGSAAPQPPVAGGGGTVSQSAPNSPIDSNAWYEVISQSSGLCLDAQGFGRANGTLLQQWTCGNHQHNQEWQFQPAAAGGYDAAHNGNAPSLVWDNTNGSRANGNGLQLWTYFSGNPNQEWKPVPLGNGLWEFVNLGSGLCLDNTGSASTGVRMTQWQCKPGNRNQEWRLAFAGTAFPPAPSGGGGGTVSGPVSTPVAPQPVAEEKEEFYWKDSYGRGVGKIPESHACARGLEDDAGLCYKPCASGYHGVGPVCWRKGKESYGRGAGTIPSNIITGSCPRGKENQAGLCYVPCRSGYYGKGPVCWRKGSMSYGRGVGKPLLSLCKPGEQADAGLCYPDCRADYHGIGPVCWGNNPPGYVDCGAGFAENSGLCAKVVAEQTSSVLALSLNFVPGGEAAGEARSAANAGAHAEEVFKALEPIMGSLRDVAKGAKESKGGTASGLLAAWRRLSPEQQQRIHDSVEAAHHGYDKATLPYKTYNGAQAGIAMAGETNPIDLLREAATIAAVADPTGVLDVVAAYAWPVYGVKY